MVSLSHIRGSVKLRQRSTLSVARHEQKAQWHDMFEICVSACYVGSPDIIVSAIETVISHPSGYQTKVR